MFKGSLEFTTPMLFAIGLVSQFTIGGISGVMHAAVPVDQQHNDSYFVVAHFHYVLFGGSIFAILGGIYFWFPKVTGRMLDDRIGRWNFWATFIAFNATFFPMHFLGLAGMPRRYYTYGENSGWSFWNLVVSIGAFCLGASILLFVYNIARSLRYGEIAGNNPWDAPTLEWSIPSPPPVYNFAEIPHVTARDQLWADKYGHGTHAGETDVDVRIAGVKVGEVDVPDESAAEQAARRDPHSSVGVQVDTGTKEEVHHIHMPNPSYYPLIAAAGLFIMAMGLLFDTGTITIGLLHMPVASAVGLIVLALGAYGWAFEPAG
jgi:cytochrome c oxidase subunit I